jgi:hypothetical protein
LFGGQSRRQRRRFLRARRSVAQPRSAGVDVFQRAIRHDRLRRDFRDVDLVIRELITVFHEQPLVAPGRASLDPKQRPLAEHLLSVHAELQVAALDRFHRIIARPDELPRAVVPDDHVPGAVVPFRDHAFERRVVVRMILGHHRQPLHARVI